MSAPTDGGPAFPQLGRCIDESRFDAAAGKFVAVDHLFTSGGARLRDLFAIHAPHTEHDCLLGDDINALAEWSYRYADAMLAAREAKG